MWQLIARSCCSRHQARWNDRSQWRFLPKLCFYSTTIASPKRELVGGEQIMMLNAHTRGLLKQTLDQLHQEPGRAVQLAIRRAWTGFNHSASWVSVKATSFLRFISLCAPIFCLLFMRKPFIDRFLSPWILRQTLLTRILGPQYSGVRTCCGGNDLDCTSQSRNRLKWRVGTNRQRI